LCEKVPKVYAPQNYTFIEYCATENWGREIQFFICSGALIPWALFPQMFLPLVFLILFQISMLKAHIDGSDIVLVEGL
jgi:hypothetical protein